MQEQETSMKPAPLWRRLAAMLYDSFLVISLSFLVGFVNLAIQMKIYGADQLKQMTEEGQSLGGPIFYTALLLTIFSFFSYFWISKGQTLGMQAWRLHILNESGNRISMQQALVRFVVAFPALLTGLLGVLWVLWDRNHKSWQDYASRSGTYHIPAVKSR